MTRLLVYALILNEAKKAFSILFESLKEKLGLNPIIYTSDFKKSLTKVIKRECFQKYILLNVFWILHIVFLSISKNISKNIQKILFSIKILFFRVLAIYIIYIKKIKIKNKYDNNNSKDFFVILIIIA